MNRYWWMAAVLVGVGLAAIWIGPGQTPIGVVEPSIKWQFSANPEIVLGVLPFRSDEELEEEFRPLLAYLSHHLGCPVKMNIAVDYLALANLLDNGKVQMAWCSHSLFAERSASGTWEALCRPVRQGEIRTRGAILVRDDSPIRALADLAGKRFAYVDPHSGSGFRFPAQLFRQNGLDPLRAFADVVFTGNHSRSLQAVASQEVDAAAVFLDRGGGEDLASGSIPVGFRAVAWTGWIPTDPLVVLRRTSPERKRTLTRLFVDMSRETLGSATLDAFRQRRGYEAFLPEAEIQQRLAQ